VTELEAALATELTIGSISSVRGNFRLRIGIARQYEIPSRN
jgi:hypothetical protein